MVPCCLLWVQGLGSRLGGRPCIFENAAHDCRLLCCGSSDEFSHEGGRMPCCTTCITSLQTAQLWQKCWGQSVTDSFPEPCADACGSHGCGLCHSCSSCCQSVKLLVCLDMISFSTSLMEPVWLQKPHVSHSCLTPSVRDTSSCCSLVMQGARSSLPYSAQPGKAASQTPATSFAAPA